MSQNNEVIEWLKKKAEAVPMPGARKMYEAAAKALEAAQPEHGTNLAPLGTDCISRQQAIDALRKLREEDIEDYGCEIPEGFNQDHLDRATFAIKQLPPIQPTFDARDTQYNIPIGTDCISRQDAIDWVLEGLNNMPSAQPEIIRCRNCKFASGDSRICMKFGHSPIGELDFCAWAERRTDEE